MAVDPPGSSPIAAPIDWRRYKLLCERPDVMSRWMVTRTAALLPAPLGESLLAALDRQPLPKPPDHRGGSDTDMFEIELAATEVDAILAMVERSATAGVTTTEGRGLGGFVAAWREFQAS